MARFSERVGARVSPRQVQLESMDDALRNSLWNAVLPRLESFPWAHAWSKAAAGLADDVFKLPVDLLPGTDDRDRAWIRERFFRGAWHETYDILEYLVTNVDAFCSDPEDGGFYREQRLDFTATMNDVLERELSGYRFVRGQLVAIAEPTEILAIEEAAVAASTAGLGGVRDHLDAALGFLGQKPQPDHRNSIKESISAVEAAVNIVAGGKGNGVADALARLSARSQLHGALQAALKQLYGYTSDESGIRHALLDEPNVGFAEAKFMLVTCSAFVHFLLEKARTGGLL